jgi:hypothetical protein
VRRLALLALIVLAAGCGGGGQRHVVAKPPHLPRALARSWSRQATAVAAALAAGDGCGAQQQSIALRTQVIAAVNARRVPPRLLEPLTSAVNSLSGRISCTPSAPAPTKPKEHPKPHEKPKPPKHGPSKKHKK